LLFGLNSNGATLLMAVCSGVMNRNESGNLDLLAATCVSRNRYQERDEWMVYVKGSTFGRGLPQDHLESGLAQHLFAAFLTWVRDELVKRKAGESPTHIAEASGSTPRGALKSMNRWNDGSSRSRREYGNRTNIFI
jgi:hypothetical protein